MGCTKPDAWLIEALVDAILDEVVKIFGKRITPDAVGKAVAARYAKNVAGAAQATGETGSRRAATPFWKGRAVA